MNERPSFYAIIPADVRYDAALSANAKLLYGEITALTEKRGYCWASNAYFAELYGVDARTIQRWIKSLADAQHIRVDVEAKARRISLLIKGDKNVATPTTKMSPPHDKNVTHIITGIITNDKESADALSRERLERIAKAFHDRMNALDLLPTSHRKNPDKAISNAIVHLDRAVRLDDVDVDTLRAALASCFDARHANHWWIETGNLRSLTKLRKRVRNSDETVLDRLIFNLKHSTNGKARNSNRTISAAAIANSTREAKQLIDSARAN